MLCSEEEIDLILHWHCAQDAVGVQPRACFVMYYVVNGCIQHNGYGSHCLTPWSNKYRWAESLRRSRGNDCNSGYHSGTERVTDAQEEKQRDGDGLVRQC